jgi:hypothetical protein
MRPAAPGNRATPAAAIAAHTSSRSSALASSNPPTPPFSGVEITSGVETTSRVGSAPETERPGGTVGS